MAKNDFKALATGENANVLTQADYEELAALSGRFSSGIARSEQLNKAWRQASTIAAVVTSFMADKSGETFWIRMTPQLCKRLSLKRC